MMCTPVYHYNGFVATHALDNMIDGYYFLAMKIEFLLNFLVVYHDWYKMGNKKLNYFNIKLLKEEVQSLLHQVKLILMVACKMPNVS